MFDFITKKNVHVSVWINGPEYSVAFTVPPNDKDRRTFKPIEWSWAGGVLETLSSGETKKSDSPWASDMMVVDNANIPGTFNSSGPVEFFAFVNGKQVRHEWQDVNSRTGGFGSGTMDRVQSTLIGPDYVVQYTFHESRNFTPHHLYVTLAPPRAGWMGSVAKQGSPGANNPLGCFVLPAAHNCGMYTIDTVKRIFQAADAASISGLLPLLPSFWKLLALPIGSIVSETIRLTSVNQADSITTQLHMGVRYFELRASKINPAMMRVANLSSDPPLADTLYFHHNVFPGMPLDGFYDEVVAFLAQWPEEIVVVYTEISQWSGEHDAVGAKTQLETWRRNALSAHGSTIAVGTLQDLRTLTVNQLRAAGKRLICAYKDECNLNSQFASERHADTPEAIVKEFELTAAQQQPSDDWALLQCQATLMENDTSRILAFAARDNVLLKPKASWDPVTVRWLQQNLTTRFARSQLVVIMNDFFDMATADTAIQASTLRFAAA